MIGFFRVFFILFLEVNLLEVMNSVINIMKVKMEKGGLFTRMKWRPQKLQQNGIHGFTLSKMKGQQKKINIHGNCHMQKI